MAFRRFELALDEGDPAETRAVIRVLGEPEARILEVILADLADQAGQPLTLISSSHIPMTDGPTWTARQVIETAVRFASPEVKEAARVALQAAGVS